MKIICSVIYNTTYKEHRIIDTNTIYFSVNHALSGDIAPIYRLAVKSDLCSLNINSNLIIELITQLVHRFHVQSIKNGKRLRDRECWITELIPLKACQVRNRKSRNRIQLHRDLLWFYKCYCKHVHIRIFLNS